MPAPVFDSLYGPLFPLYRKTVRLLYLLKGAVLYRARDDGQWRMVKDIYDVMPYTLVGSGGLEVTYQAVEELDEKGIGGDIIELGVARGGCAALMGKVMFEPGGSVNARRLWLFDSFEGLPEPTKEDFGSTGGRETGDHIRPLPKGSCLGTLEEVENLIYQQNRFPRDRVILVKGWFQDTVPEYASRIGKVALLRIDGDWYESTKACLEGLFDLVVPDGTVIIDDYQTCHGCRKAVDEFLSGRQLSVEMMFDGRGGSYFKKPIIT